MNFVQEAAVTEQFPLHYTALIKVTGLTDRVRLLQPTERLKQEIASGAPGDRILRAIEVWRGVFGRMGAKPKYKSSLESLFDSFKESGKLFEINEIVDFYNYYSLHCASPMGAYDLDKIDDGLRLSFVGKGRSFTPLGSPKNAQTTKDREVAYSDKTKVTCRYWNLQDCFETKISEETRNILFMFDLVADGHEAATEQFRLIANEFNEAFSGQSHACGITGSGLAQEIVV